jgi:hypothetical protein
MKKTIGIFIGIISFLFINVQTAQAKLPNPLDYLKQPVTVITIAPTNTPTPIIIKQIDPNLIQKIPIVTLGAKNTVTPTPTLGTKDTVTPTSEVTETVTQEEPDKATGAGTAADTTASNAANAATPAPAGIQTKDIVTYVLIGAILVVLLAQAFWPKKGKTPETKPEEPKNG